MNDIEYDLPQGPILDSLLFNKHLCHRFYYIEDEDVEYYADDTTIYIL